MEALQSTGVALLESIFGATVLVMFITISTLAWVLATKRNAASALAWCMLVIVFPVFGAIFFFVFGDQHVRRRLSRKRKQLLRFRRAARVDKAIDGAEESNPTSAEPGKSEAIELFRLGIRFGSFRPLEGNDVQLFFSGEPAYRAMLEDIRSAKHHIHLETYILQSDVTGKALLTALCEMAAKGVEVRLVYDAIGSNHLRRKHLSALMQAGGKISAFLPLNILRQRSQINLRNHRKLLIVDGAIAYTGGLNHGDEYLGEVKIFGRWRDTHMRIRGAAVRALQLIFAEDWNFASDEDLEDMKYFPKAQTVGTHRVQVVDSGPDRDPKAIRELYFAAILEARERVWIATPYFIPDEGILNALCLAGYRGLDVRILGLHHPDKWTPLFAGQYYWSDMLAAGVKVYQYSDGMMHSKLVLVDHKWASIGTANMDNRSLHLNFEVNCVTDSQEIIEQLGVAFERDFSLSIRLDRQVYARRPLAGRMIENACRLFSPVL